MATMSAALGVSLTTIGARLTSTQARVRRWATSGTVPNSMPPCLMLGHEMFISSTSMPSAPPSLAAQSMYVGKSVPKKLTHTEIPRSRRKGSLSRRKASTPTFSRPIELSMPPAVSQIRGSGLPWRGSGEMPLVDMPAERAQVGEGRELLAVREAAGGGQERRGEAQGAEFAGEVDRPRGPEP
jgi:hypothetical protein